jgi:hypothetical protein
MFAIQKIRIKKEEEKEEICRVDEIDSEGSKTTQNLSTRQLASKL